MQRQPAVAGRFYPGRAELLLRTLEQLIPAAVSVPALGIMVPHAGYVYSGSVAGATFARVDMPSRVVILGPNHHGYGPAASLYAKGTWLTPLGEIAIDEELALQLLASCPLLEADTLAHHLEHSLEVQVPFIQKRSQQTRLVPICLGHLQLPQLLELGAAIGKTLAASPGETLLVASSDMTHYEPEATARRKDHGALAFVLDLDPAGLYRHVVQERITMCGVLPTVVMLAAARTLGATHAELVQYATSGDVTGDQSEVVGYAGVIVS
ncbi:MAG: AmmeMemoRadiSam system protein B [Desulfuromonadales bacterium GWD2_61_12]|nr:MAG: AmmeMemoRadiSam system protein B [Desulfuromonadales bacterium GWC2_61_20]OGR32183.1 MAG: AmmeMemoRadiSam system protein B [Desulfuromonadales bacterium GWD2_61_12]HAD04127.1 AmmeMemoRadiSam system protein B [Desulfuromonas sp.]